MNVRRTLVCLVAVTLAAQPLAGQTFDPETDALVSLLAVPDDGVSYFYDRARARAMIAAGNGAEAARISERLTGAYPRDGQNWIFLGRARELLGEEVLAARAYEQAIALLGWAPVTLVEEPGDRAALMVEAASSYLAAGDTASALSVLRRGVRDHHYPFPGELFGDGRLAGLRENAAFLELVGRADASGLTRDAGWRSDLELLYTQALESRPLSRLDPVPAEFGRRYDALLRSIPQLSDEEIVVEMNRMLAALHQGHTWLIGFEGSRIRSRGLPVLMWLFPEGVYVVNASNEYADLIGARVVRIGRVPIEEAMRRATLIHSVDGDMQYTTDVMRAFRHTGLLKGLGLTTSLDSAEFVVQRPGGPERTVVLSPKMWTYSGRMPAPRNVEAPLFLRDVTQMHWETALPAADAHYIQVNNMFDDPDETLAQFAIRLRGILDERRPKNLIVDVRQNTGGNSALHTELLRTIIAFSAIPGRQVYVVTGRKTYSAASNFITDLERFASPVFAGEAPAECCNFYADATPVFLPFSRMTGAVSALWSARSADALDRRREISPYVPVQLTAADYFAGRDPVLSAVLRIIAESAARDPNSDD